MKTSLTIELTEADYKELLASYLLGSLIANEVNQPSREELIQTADLVNKLCEVGFKNKVKGFKQLQKDLYSFPQQVEDKMLKTYNEFIEYVDSGDREDELEAMKQQINDMRKQGLV